MSNSLLNRIAAVLAFIVEMLIVLLKPLKKYLRSKWFCYDFMSVICFGTTFTLILTTLKYNTDNNFFNFSLLIGFQYSFVLITIRSFLFLRSIKQNFILQLPKRKLKYLKLNKMSNLLKRKANVL